MLKIVEQNERIMVSDFDWDQHLLQLSYYFQGALPKEDFFLDGKPVRVLFEKTITLHQETSIRHQRIIWVHFEKKAKLSVMLNGYFEPIWLPPPAFAPFRRKMQRFMELSVDAVQVAFPNIRGARWGPGYGRKNIIHQIFRLIGQPLVGWFKSFPIIRHSYAGGWIFIERRDRADDNAEHLYRWLQKNHPEIRAWFILDRHCPDWNRLANEGFRLLPWTWRRFLPVLLSDHVISSHLCDHATVPIGHHLALLSQWRFTFLQHGVIKDDLSRWLNQHLIDLMITTTPGEHESIVGETSRYTLTRKEVRRTGLPRHDALLDRARATPPEDITLIGIMPTWRKTLIYNAEQSVASSGRDLVAKSNFVRNWVELLKHSRLFDLVVASGKKLCLLPHPNLMPYVDAFQLPDYITIIRSTDVSYQDVLCRTSVLLTDYSSVASEIAYLQRPVLYYQFDADEVFSGDAHFYEKGYFTYESDGFGPVASNIEELLVHFEKIVRNDFKPSDQYLQRMQNAFPERDGGACQRVFNSIMELRQPYGNSKQ